MTSIQNAGARLRAVAEKAAFVGPTLARLTLGVVFVATGWGKLHSLDDVTTFFGELGIPYPAFNARLTAVTEFGGGVLLLCGLATRLASLPLAFTMVVAILTAKRHSIDGLSTLLGFEEWSYFVLFIWIAVAGPGPISLDAWLARWRARRQEVVRRSDPLLQPHGQNS